MRWVCHRCGRRMFLVQFNHFVAKLKAVGIAVYPFKNSSSEPLPDAVFPNNWISLHRDGTLVLYPMLTPNRSAERDPKILYFLQENFAVKELIDFTSAKVDGKIVEGTGSIVDHIHRIAYACLSQRTHLDFSMRSVTNSTTSQSPSQQEIKTRRKFITPM